MDYNILFNDIEDSLVFFFQINGLNYKFERNEVECNNKIIETSYVALKQYWYNSNINLRIEFVLIHYLGYSLKNKNGYFHISVFVNKYENDELCAFLSLDNYMRYNGLKIKKLEEYDGECIKDKINCFMKNVIDEKIIQILRGETWMSLPTYWGNYK